ncbi:MAG: hypothetical protein KC503_01890 [Myxococcales bacterium]|nr:hypothetical protein [Myxococcales bacterium]
MARLLATCVLSLATLLAAAPARADAVADAIAKAQADGLPVAPLQSKAAEGKAKRVAPDRIAKVIEQLARFMRHARDHYARSSRATPRVPPSHPSAAQPSAALLAAIAEARLAGIAPGQLFKLVPNPAAAAAARRVDALSDLHLRGFPAGRALRLVQRARASDLAGLGRLADTLRKRGFTPAGAIDELTVGVERGNSLAAHAANAARRGAAPAATKGRGRARGHDKK